MLLFATLGARRRGRLARRRLPAAPNPDPAPVTTSRATVIEVTAPFETESDARAWLRQTGESRLAADVAELNRALHAYRLVTADPYVRTVSRAQALVARIGYGRGEEVADGHWTDARELLPVGGRPRRAKALEPQAQLAAVLSGRSRPLVCEELVLRARADIEEGRDRVAARQLLAALDAAFAELPGDEPAQDMSGRVAELQELRAGVAEAADRALTDVLGDRELECVENALGRLEAALRARALARAGLSGR